MGTERTSCGKCHRKCAGQVLAVGDTYYHNYCFTCKECGSELGENAFYNKDGQFYCSKDYLAIFGEQCFKCNQLLEGEVISALGNTFHLDCFSCGNCRKFFPPGENVIFDGRDYLCEACDAGMEPSPQVPLHQCSGCRKEIATGQALMALDQHWHPQCFTCHKCGVILHGEYMGKDGFAFCEKDYQSEFGVVCASCQGYITGKVLQAGDKHYHPQCSRCAKCGQMFGEGEEMYLQGSEIWHPQCSEMVREMERAEKERAERQQREAEEKEHQAEMKRRHEEQMERDGNENDMQMERERKEREMQMERERKEREMQMERERKEREMQQMEQERRERDIQQQMERERKERDMQQQMEQERRERDIQQQMERERKERDVQQQMDSERREAEQRKAEAERREMEQRRQYEQQRREMEQRQQYEQQQQQQQQSQRDYQFQANVGAQIDLNIDGPAQLNHNSDNLPPPNFSPPPSYTEPEVPPAPPRPVEMPKDPPAPPTRTASRGAVDMARYGSLPRSNGTGNGRAREPDRRPKSYHEGSTNDYYERSSSSTYKSSVQMKLSKDDSSIGNQTRTTSTRSSTSSYTGPQQFYPYDELKKPPGTRSRIRGIKEDQLEHYLRDEEFRDIFKMNKDEFYLLPKWKQTDQKKKMSLF